MAESNGRSRASQRSFDPFGVPRRTTSANPSSTREPSLNFDGFADDLIPNGETGSGYSPSVASRSMRSRTSADSLARSSAETWDTNATSYLPALQVKGASEEDNLYPLEEEGYDPRSFDIVAPLEQGQGPKAYSLEDRSDLLFSKEHMRSILEDPRLLGDFSRFLSRSRPGSVALLKYYLSTEKAVRAIRYANSVIANLGTLDGHDFAEGDAGNMDTVNRTLQEKHDAAFETLAIDELPRFITDVWVDIVSLSMRRKIMGSMPTDLRDASEGLAEVFCLSDPSRHDNPIILASDEFHRTTQYGMDYAIGRNCRFLQGPRTNPFSVQRIRERVKAGQEHIETFLNYRRDGSPFMNLLLCAPLFDSKGKVRYFLGAQVDVSGLVKDCTKMDGLRRIVEDEQQGVDRKNQAPKSSLECCQALGEMLDTSELEVVRRHGGAIHQMRDHDAHGQDTNWNTPYLVIEDDLTPHSSPQATPAVPDMSQPGTTPKPASSPVSGRLAGVYEHYLLVRPSSNLQILFASPSLRVPGMLQSPLLSRVGGSGRVRDQIGQALSEGQGVTARVRWITSTRRKSSPEAEQRGRFRWLHCTPLRGVNGTIGIWMVVVLDDENASKGSSRDGSSGGAYSYDQRAGRQGKVAPPIDAHGDRRAATSVYAESVYQGQQQQQHQGQQQQHWV